MRARSLGRDADSSVTHDERSVGGLASHRDSHRFPLAVLERVADEVRRELHEAEPIPSAVDARVALEPDLLARRRAPLGVGHDLADDLGEIHVFDVERQPSGRDARHLEQCADELVEPLGLALHRRAALDELRRALAREARHLVGLQRVGT
jgi:hypothetical protein